MTGRPMDNSEYQLSLDQVKRVFNRAAGTYQAASVVQQEIGQRLLDRLNYLRIDPKVVIDLGCGTGGALEALRSRYPKAGVVGLDISEGMLGVARKCGRWFRRPRLVAADAASLPLADDCADLIYSNLMLPWCSDPEPVWAELQRVLRPGGAVLFTTLGPDTLQELRAATSAIDSRQPHVHAFTDMHDIGDALLRHGIADPVMDAEKIRVEYASPAALVLELRRSGSTNIIGNRRRGLGGPISLRELSEQYPESNAGGKTVATVEVVYGHGWAAASGGSKDTSGEVFVPLSSLRRNVSGT